MAPLDRFSYNTTTEAKKQDERQIESGNFQSSRETTKFSFDKWETSTTKTILASLRTGSIGTTKKLKKYDDIEASGSFWSSTLDTMQFDHSSRTPTVDPTTTTKIVSEDSSTTKIIRAKHFKTTTEKRIEALAKQNTKQKNDQTEITKLASSEGFTQGNRMTNIEASSSTTRYIDSTNAIKNQESKRATRKDTLTYHTNSRDTASEIVPTEWFSENHKETTVLLDAVNEGKVLVIHEEIYYLIDLNLKFYLNLSIYFI